MKYLKTYKIFESDDSWRRKTDDVQFKELSYELDDILLDISDEGFPYVQPSLISGNNLFVEITGTEKGAILYDDSDKFEIDINIKNVLERIVSLVESKGYKYNMEIFYSVTYEDVSIDEYIEGYTVEFKNDQWVMINTFSSKGKGIAEYKPTPLDKPDPIDIVGKKPTAITLKISK